MSEKHIHVMITTYNRQQHCLNLLRDIEAESEGYRVTVTVIDDSQGLSGLINGLRCDMDRLSGFNYYVVGVYDLKLNLICLVSFLGSRRLRGCRRLIRPGVPSEIQDIECEFCTHGEITAAIGKGLGAVPYLSEDIEIRPVLAFVDLEILSTQADLHF